MAGTRRNFDGVLSIQDINVDSLYSAFILDAAGPVFDQTRLFTYGLSQQVANSQQFATRVHTNVPRSGLIGLPMGWEMFIQRWRATTNIRLDEPIFDWAAESSAQLIYNDKLKQATPLLDLLMAPHAFYNIEPVEEADNPYDQGRTRAVPAGPMPIWMRENLTYEVLIQTSSRAVQKLQEFLIEHTRGHRMIFWIWLDGVMRQDVRR